MVILAKPTLALRWMPWWGFFLSCALFLILSSRSSGENSYQLVIGENVQQLCDWGVTLSPLDWDGNFMLRDPQRTASLCRRLDVTVARILIGGISSYDNRLKTAEKRTLEWAVVPQVNALVSSGIRRYVLCFVTAPSTLKEMYSYRFYVDGITNGLKPGMESAMANYIVDVVKVLEAANLPVPYAIGVQVDPGRPAADYGCPATLAQGTPYTYNGWSRLVHEVRSRLDAALFTHVGIIGPESSDHTWLKNLLSDPAFSADGSPLAGVSFLGSNGAPLSERKTQKGEDSNVWMLAADPIEARNEPERIITTFEAMYRDLAHHGVSHWFFRYLYGPDPSPEVLIYGHEQPDTELFEALAGMWNWIKPPAQLSRCWVEDSEAGVVGLRFRQENGRVALLLVTSGPLGRTLAILQDTMRPNRIISYTREGSRELSLANANVGSPLRIEAGITLVFGLEK